MKQHIKSVNYFSIFAFIIVLSFSHNSIATIINNKWENYNLQGKVWSINEISYEAIDRFGNIEKGNRMREHFVYSDLQLIFDDKGNLTEKNSYASDGSIREKITYKYDKTGNLIEQNEKKYSIATLSSNITIKYKYDSNGNLLEQDEYNPDGGLRKKIIYQYDDKRNNIEKREYKNDGSLNEIYTYKYNNKNNIIEINFFNNNGFLLWKKTHKYDNRNNCIEINHFFQGEKITDKNTYEYNEKGLLINENRFFNGSLQEKQTYKYNENGNITEYNHHKTYVALNEEKDKEMTYEYFYDQRGNWYKRVISINKIPRFIEEREIKYYNE